MKVKDVKHKVTLDDFEYRLLVGCVNVARTMYLEPVSYTHLTLPTILLV